jgi:hypothetical protein
MVGKMTFNELEKLAEECEALLEKYAKNLNELVEQATHKAIDTNSAKELRFLKTHLELNYVFNAKLRLSLSKLENHMRWVKKGINDTLIRLETKSTNTFYIPKEKEFPEDISCPYCRKINKKFTYGELCQHCHRMIANPWKEKTTCPKCSTQINRSQIFEAKEDYEFDPKKNNFITCENAECQNRFDWKKHREEPKVFGLNVCINCDMDYIPDKRNYKKQLVCRNCKDMGVTSHQIDNPDYPKNYREKMRKKKKVT